MEHKSIIDSIKCPVLKAGLCHLSSNWGLLSAAKQIEQLRAEIDSLKAYKMFYDHIRRELPKDLVVCCKICDQTFEMITGVSEQELKGGRK